MSLLLKLWAAVAIAFAGTGHQVARVKAPNLSHAVSCGMHPIDCAKGFYVYHSQLNAFSQSILSGLERSYVDIGKDWDNAPYFQEKMEKELKNKSDL